MLHELIKALPEPVRQAYGKTVRGNTQLQERLKVCSALELWRRGYRQIEFEKPLQLVDGSLAYVDVFSGGLNPVAVECETAIQAAKIRGRAEELRKAQPNVRVVLAIPDRVAFSAKTASKVVMFSKEAVLGVTRVARLVDEVWLVAKDGAVADLKTGIRRYRQRVERLLNRQRMEELLAKYEEAKDSLEWSISLRDATCGEAGEALRKAARLLLGDKAGELGGVRVLEPVMDGYVKGFKELMESIRTEILQMVVDLANEILSTHTDIMLELKEGEHGPVCVIRKDYDAEEWLGLSDKPIT